MIGTIGGTLFLLFLYPRMRIWMTNLRGERFAMISKVIVGLMAMLIVFQFYQLISNT